MYQNLQIPQKVARFLLLKGQVVRSLRTHMQLLLQVRMPLLLPSCCLPDAWSGIFLIAKLTLVYPCKPLENRLSRLLYTWSLLDVFLTFVRPKDVIRLKIRLFILRHVLPCQTLQYLMSIAYLSQYE